MILRLFNTILAILSRPYIYIQKYIIESFQSYLPTHFDEKSWYILFGLMVFSTFIIAYILSRFITLKDADDDPVYQRKRFYAIQRQHRKLS